MGDEDAGSGAEEAGNAVVEELSTHVRVHGRQRVVQQEDVSAAIHGARQVYARSLTCHW